MTALPLVDDWTCQAPRGPFDAAGTGGAPVRVRLPHDALRDADRSAAARAGSASAYYPSGAFSYATVVDVPADWAGKVVRLEVQGAFRHAAVFVDDELAGNRADGYARFFVDLTPYLRHGQPNTLRIEVRSGDDSRWYSGGGLHRPVLLHVDEPVHVVPDGLRVTTVRLEDDQAVVEVATTVTNRGLTTASLTVTTQVDAPSGERVEGDSSPLTLAPGRTTTVRHRLYLPDPQLWGVDTPSLYTATVGLGVGDDVTTTFGVRTVTVDPRRGLRVNGEPVLLRGACVHADNGPLGAASIARAEERRVELLKAAGFTAIRSTHSPASPALLDACDRLGMLVVDEAFDVWTRAKTARDYAFDFPQWWAADLESMVAKDYNHPSVLMYSIGNEIVEVGTPHGSALARELAEHVRGLDPTRLVTNCVNAMLAVLDELPALDGAGGGDLNEMMAGMVHAMSAVGASPAVTRRTAESSAALDVLGLNYAEGRYALDAELFPHRVIVGSETFPQLIGTLWPQVVANPNVIGDFTWTGWDYLGEVGIGATAYADEPGTTYALGREFPYLTADCGDLDLTGWRRPVSYYREIVYGLRTAPVIAVQRPARHGQRVAFRSPWGWSDAVSSWTWPGFEGRPVTVEVYADADEVALLRDGEEVARSRVGERLPKVAELETTYLPGTLEAVAYRDGAPVGRTELRSAVGETLLTLTADRPRVRADDTDLAYLAVELRDADGVLVTGADVPVTVEVNGAGTLVGYATGQPSTTERFDATTRTTYDGRALAVVRPTGVGEIVVRAQAPGLGEAVVRVQAG